MSSLEKASIPNFLSKKFLARTLGLASFFIFTGGSVLQHSNVSAQTAPNNPQQPGSVNNIEGFHPDCESEERSNNPWINNFCQSIDEPSGGTRSTGGPRDDINTSGAIPNSDNGGTLTIEQLRNTVDSSNNH